MPTVSLSPVPRPMLSKVRFGSDAPTPTPPAPASGELPVLVNMPPATTIFSHALEIPSSGAVFQVEVGPGSPEPTVTSVPSSPTPQAQHAQSPRRPNRPLLTLSAVAALSVSLLSMLGGSLGYRLTQLADREAHRRQVESQLLRMAIYPPPTTGTDPNGLSPDVLQANAEAFHKSRHDPNNLSRRQSEEIKLLVKHARPSVVAIGNPIPPDAKAWFDSRGSGVVISSQGLVLTNAHVVKDQRKVFLMAYNGKVQPGEVMARDEDLDLALVSFNPNEQSLPALKLSRDKADLTGTTVVALGHPLGHGWNASKGMITGSGYTLLDFFGDKKPKPGDKPLGLKPPKAYPGLISTDANINPGNSGGPLLDLDAQIVGINTFQDGVSGSGLGLSTPGHRAYQFVVDSLRKLGFDPAEKGFAP